MVRVGNLKNKVRRGEKDPSPDGLTPKEQIKAIEAETSLFDEDLQATWAHLKHQLETEGIFIVRPQELTPTERSKVLKTFMNEIFPALTPIALDAGHSFPFIPSMALTLLLSFQNPSGKESLDALVILPTLLPRFIPLVGRKQCYLLLEDLVLMNIAQIFPRPLKLVSQTLFRILRDSELEIDEEGGDLRRVMMSHETALKHRRGNIIRVSVAKKSSFEALDILKRNLPVNNDILFYDDFIAKGDLKELIRTGQPKLLFKPFKPSYPWRHSDFKTNCFEAIRSKDIVIYHPFESFDMVMHFLREAARDPSVISIKQTIYRTSSKSPVIDALIEAARNGKSVTAVIELKARFDEKANLRWARKLEKAGVQVCFSFKSVKIHAKLALVTRQTGKKIENYVHFGTGNYHPETAKIYSDISLFTCNKDLCHDAMLLFNYMTSHARPKKLVYLGIAPINLRQRLKELILLEIMNARNGAPAQIWFKCNSLADPQIIDLLYEASQAGVKIELIVRGICALRPGVKGLSENIRVLSLVGRFLEHARIYCFANGHEMPSAEGKVFISSTDLMSHNLDHRIEALVEITKPFMKGQILDKIMIANLRDQTQSWQMQPDGVYIRMFTNKGGFAAHNYFIKNGGLSGLGKVPSSLISPRRASARKTGL